MRDIWKDHDEFPKIAYRIGVPALLEQLAEECAELGQAALKMARILRGENPTPMDATKAISNIAEESADVQTCLIELYRAGFDVDSGGLIRWRKIHRWHDRLEEEEAKHNETR